MALNRRDLLLIGAASALPFSARAGLTPPSSPYYLIFVVDGVYQVTNLRVIYLPPSYGTAEAYTRINVASLFQSTFDFTGVSGVGVWRQLLNAPSYRWWEVVDQRNGLIYKLWEGDKLEARFSDGSRVKVQFNRPDALAVFKVLVGTERRADGTRVYPRQGCHCHGDKGRDGRDSGVTQIRPPSTSFSLSWSWGSVEQEIPW